MHKFVELLSITQISHIIPVIEQGLELTKLEYLATKDPDKRNQISASCVLLSFLRLRKLDINGPGGDVLDDVV